MPAPDSITINTNHWRVPSAATAFDGWLEGTPSEAEKLQVIAKTIADRANWKPNAQAMALVIKLKSFIGCRVQIEFWDSCMWLFPEEAPYPLNATCRGVILLQDGDFLQAFIEVSNVVEVTTPDGYSSLSYLQKRPESEHVLAPLADLYQITKI